jgi:hypothetical protein
MYSDEAAIINELQKESKMLHLELMRVKQTRQEIETELGEVSTQLDATCRKYSPETHAKQQKLIRQLENEVATRRIKNQATKARVVEMRADHEVQVEASEQAKQRVGELQTLVNAEQKQIKALNLEMAQMKQRNQDELMAMQAQL